MGRISAAITVLLLSVAALPGCGGKSSPEPGPVPVTGSVVQGAVMGALVFCDHLTGAEANHKMDPDEAEYSSTTGANGSFELPDTPDYAYMIVSQGGTDSITGQPAMEMFAPAGAKNVSPLTMLVVLNPGAKAAIENLGVKYDDNVAESLTPAAALLLQSIQSAVDALTRSLNTGGDSMPTSQINNIQQAVMNSVAASIEGRTVTELTTPAALTATLTTAVENAVPAIVGSQTGGATITISNANAFAAAAVGQSVDTVAQAIIATGASLSNTTTKTAETTLITPSGVEAINNAIDNSVNNTVETVEVIPAPAPVISGTPATNVAVGVAYSFTPTVSNSSQILTFSIANKPAWATFNTLTGALTGIPASAHVGTTSGIVITVSNGAKSASLAPFSLRVFVPTGSTGGGS